MVNGIHPNSTKKVSGNNQPKHQTTVFHSLNVLGWCHGGFTSLNCGWVDIDLSLNPTNQTGAKRLGGGFNQLSQNGSFPEWDQKWKMFESTTYLMVHIYLRLYLPYQLVSRTLSVRKTPWNYPFKKLSKHIKFTRNSMWVKLQTINFLLLSGSYSFQPSIFRES